MSMTKEEAIKQLESLYDYCENMRSGDNDFAVWERDCEAIKIALSALRPVTREQVEKVWRGEWVKRHKHRGGFRRVKGIDDMGGHHEVTIDERCEYDDLYCPKCGKQSPDNFLNFCGYCGEAFTDEAVDIVMERLEGMDNGTVPCDNA